MAHALSVFLVVLAFCLLLSGLDDLVITVAYACLRFRRAAAIWPSQEQLQAVATRRIAILVPLWAEHRVLARMLAHNLGGIRHPQFDFFVGLYPNDEPTVRVALEFARRSEHVHLCMCPHEGPTSKADCLNWVWQGVLDYERRQGIRYDIVITHDAEDLIHPEALRVIQYFCEDFDMVQVPVLPLATPLRRWTHGLYCDEFAEYQLKDIAVRQAWGGFMAGNGVGTGLRRSMVDRLQRQHGRLFDPSCLTEDYETGWRVHELGGRQLFVPLRPASPVATREYFPARAGPAIRQRTRWITGIALQGWLRHRWQAPPSQWYWLWRDRKGLFGNLVAPLANLFCLLGLAGGIERIGWAAPTLLATITLAAVQLGIRMRCVALLYGWRMAMGVPVRAIWGNCLNGAATTLALRNFALHLLGRRPLGWAKTSHSYPHWAAAPLLEQAAIARGTARALPAAVALEWKVIPYRVAGGRLLVASTRPPTPLLLRALRHHTPLHLRFRIVSEEQFDELARRYLFPLSNSGTLSKTAACPHRRAALPGRAGPPGPASSDTGGVLQHPGIMGAAEQKNPPAKAP